MKLRAVDAFDAARARLRARRADPQEAGTPAVPLGWHVQEMGARVDVADNEAVVAALEGR